MAMDRFDFQLVLIAVVLGLAIAELLTCISHMLMARHRTRVYWVHLVWLVTLFLIAVQYWHVLFSWKAQGSLGDSFGQYMLSLMFPVTLYVSAAMLGPNVPPDADLFDFRDYYYQNHRGIFAACAVTLATMIVSNTILLDIDLLATINLYRYIPLALLVVLAVSANKILHSIAALLLLAMLVFFATMLADN
tara:strand:- start:32186 stop:32758 length:573 start_codon:yes stop_codon:yes gene_type:complete